MSQGKRVRVEDLVNHEDADSKDVEDEEEAVDSQRKRPKAHWEQGPPRCDICHANFATESNLRRHTRQVS